MASFEPLRADGLEDVELHLCALHDAPSHAQLASLSDAERTRAQCFAHAHNWRRYCVAHGALRQTLAPRVDGSPAGLEFTIEEHGKPRLVSAPDCHFNLSHSDDWAMLGVSRSGEIGVDIEVIRSISDAQALARRHYSAAEREACEREPPGARRDLAFLRIWTRKEACMKAVGLGLRLAPSSFEAGAGPQASHVQVRTPGGYCSLEVRSVETGIEAVAAVALWR